MKPFIITTCLFLAIIGLASTAGLFILIEPGTEGRLHHITRAGKLFLYKHAMIDDLSQPEAKTLYRTSCTKKCHSTDVIEKTPRTAVEWEWVVARMERRTVLT